ncbi:Lrp/AsnC family transcriptional regulator [Kocuria sp. KH4]|jgi:DNA-binding Lrp family transcriptional regulator
MPTVHTLDALDARILLALDDDPAATVLALARTLGVARNTVHARLRRLTEGGVLRSPSRRVDPRALGYDLTAFVELSIRQGAGEEALAGLRAIPEIIEIHATTGDADLLARVVARGTEDLHRITNLVVETPGVLRTSTAISLLEVMPLRVTELLRRTAGER